MSYTFTQSGSEIQAILDRAEAGGQIDQDIAAKQDALTFDDAPISGSDNPVKSGGIYDAIQAGGATALAAFATDIVSGDVVSFPDGADGIPVKAFTGSILPAQSGSGDPAPDNVRPISGWTEANITRAGRNLFNPHPNHNVSAQGEYIAAGAQYWATDYIPIGNTKTVVVSVADLGGMTNGSIVRVAYASDGTVTSTNIGYFDHYTNPWTFTLADNVVGLRFRGYRQGGASPITGAKIQVEVGGSASTYEPYTADTILLDFGQTVYAGTLTALGGGKWSIQPTHEIVDLGTLTWTYSSSLWLSTGINSVVKKPASNADVADAISDTYALLSVNAIGGSTPSSIAISSTGTIYCNDNSSSVSPSGALVYALATLPAPIIVSAEDLATLLGANNVWTDCGSVTELEYRADTALYVQKLIGGGSLGLSMTPQPLSLGRIGVLLEPEDEPEPEETEAEPEAEEQAEQTEEAEEE